MQIQLHANASVDPFLHVIMFCMQILVKAIFVQPIIGEK